MMALVGNLLFRCGKNNRLLTLRIILRSENYFFSSLNMFIKQVVSKVKKKVHSSKTGVCRFCADF